MTAALKSVKGPAAERARTVLTSKDRLLLLRMCYLWPLTVVGVFLPWIVYLRFRENDELDVGEHARQGVVLSLGYTVVMVVLGLLNGLIGRLASDWVTVLAVFGGLGLGVIVVLGALGWRWVAAALEGDGVDIPFVSSVSRYI